MKNTVVSHGEMIVLSKKEAGPLPHAPARPYPNPGRDPVSAFTANILAGNPSGKSLQDQLDTMVEGIVAP